MPRYCFDGDAEVPVHPDDHAETYQILGEPMTVLVRRLAGVPYGHPIADTTYDSYTLREARDVYMQCHHLPLAEFRLRQLEYHMGTS